MGSNIWKFLRRKFGVFFLYQIKIKYYLQLISLLVKVIYLIKIYPNHFMNIFRRFPIERRRSRDEHVGDHSDGPDITPLVIAPTTYKHINIVMNIYKQ
jgi:hypothetical protein